MIPELNFLLKSYDSLVGFWNKLFPYGRFILLWNSEFRRRMNGTIGFPHTPHSALRAPHYAFCVPHPACCVVYSAMPMFLRIPYVARKCFDFQIILSSKNPEDCQPMWNPQAEFPHPLADSTIGDAKFFSLFLLCGRRGKLSLFALPFGKIKKLIKLFQGKSFIKGIVMIKNILNHFDDNRDFKLSLYRERAN